MNKIKEIWNNFLKLFKEELVTITQEINVGRADVVVFMKDGTVIQGLIQGDLNKSLENRINFFYRSLEDQTFSSLYSPGESCTKIFPVNDVKSISVRMYDNIKILTYQV